LYSRLLSIIPRVMFHAAGEGMEAEYDDDDDMQVELSTSQYESLIGGFEQLFEEKCMRRVFTAQMRDVGSVCDFYATAARINQQWMYRMVNTLAFWPQSTRDDAPQHIVRNLWSECRASSVEGSQLPARGKDLFLLDTEGLTDRDVRNKSSIFEVFCRVYSHLLLIQDEDEMLNAKPGWPFELEEITGICASLRDLLYVFLWVEPTRTTHSRAPAKQGVFPAELKEPASKVLNILFSRDEHRSFLRDGFWTEDCAALGSERFVSEACGLDIEAPPTAVISGTARACKDVLKYFPHMVPFNARAKIFSAWIGEGRNDFFGRGTWVTIRRNYIMEDAFSEMNHLKAGLKNRVQVKFIDEHGMEEAGIDGGGVFKEFMHSFMSSAFSSLYALFQATPEGLLYPNPGSAVIASNHLDQFEFLGRMLGKAIFDGVLVDLPFAGFFINKLLGKTNSVDDLRSLDPQLHKNIMFIKSCEKSEVEDLCLYFNVFRDNYGQSTTVDLIPNGSDIPVTGSNRISYIYRLANFYLNVETREQCRAFVRGFSDLISPGMVRIFGEREFQKVLSGAADARIDVSDLRRNCNYSGGYSEDHETIRLFWQVVAELSREDQELLLKFVTSSPRAPLLGFRYLHPKFCIHKSVDEGGDKRLPTASTCMNLLRLPEYRTEETLREKLIYSLHHQQGFGLS